MNSYHPRQPRFRCPPHPLQHDRPTNPERNIDMCCTAMCSRRLVGRRAIAMPRISILMYRAKGCAVLCHAAIDLYSVVDRLRKGKTRHGAQAHGRATGCARDAIGDAPGGVSGDVSGDVP
eukprot:2965741-Pyramimonas_sp.AAC.1